jgi:hypothetical protein
LGETRARIIVFIDAGHSGTMSSGASNVEIADALNAHQVRFTVVAAAKGRQESLEGADFGSQCDGQGDHRPQTQQHRYQAERRHRAIGALPPYSQMRGQQTPWLV